MNFNFEKASASQMNLSNKKKIIELIRRHKEISRSDLGKITGLSAPSITRIVDELIEQDQLASYIGIGNSSGGRPPMIVKFNSENNFIIGIDLGATYTRGVLSDLDANFLTEIQLPTEIHKGFDYIIKNTVAIIEKLQNRRGIDKRQIRGVGFGVAGLINRVTEKITFSPDFGWEEIDFRKEIEKHIELPFYFDNSTRLMALGEQIFGESNRLKNFAVINIGYGIAAGLVIEGILTKGNSGFSGEFGHITIDKNSSIRCKCGKYGCLEALASGNRIAEMGIKLIEREPTGILSRLAENNKALVDAKLVAEAAKEGDLDALQIFEEITENICVGIGDLVNLLNPECVFIGGGISLAGDFFFEMINRKKIKFLLKPNRDIAIKPTTFAENTTSLGAVSLVLEKILNFNIPLQNLKN
jgi:predicted NBD/HSP70 family sugar kinase